MRAYEMVRKLTTKGSMQTGRSIFHDVLLCAIVLVTLSSGAQTVPIGRAVEKSIQLSRLTEPGARPFHLKAVTGPANSFIPDYIAEIEEHWVAPDKWRRTIRSKSFEQTIVVNGSKRTEMNSSDYYPKWLNDVVVAIIEVAPQQLVNEVAKLPDTVVSGTKTSVRYQPSSTDGKVTNTWWGSVEFAPPGVLTWISGKHFSAGFKDYTLFHDKHVAQAIETFPPIPHGDVNTRVEVSDFSPIDESLFAIEKPTPVEDQIRLVSMDEVEYRKTAIDPPVMKWAPVARRPTVGVLSLYIVTDKTGKVRDAKFITSNNMALQESAEALIRQWRFKPTTVDGVPAEVQTTMTFAFDTTIEGDQANYQAASYYFKRGRDLTYPRTDGSPAFHLKGTFAWTGSSGTHQGVYEEFWFAANRWRREITITGVKTVETRIDDDHYAPPPPSDFGPLVARAVSLFGAEFPGYAYYSPDWDWHLDDVMFDSKPCLRVSMGPTENLPAGQYPRAYYFDSDGLVLARSQSKDLISYENFQLWAGKQVPRRITLRFGEEVVLGAQIDLIEPAIQKEDDFFTIPNVKPEDWVRPAPW
jgi:TonB family protein